VKKGVFLILCLEGAILSFNVAACSALIPSIAAEFKVAQFLAGRIIWMYMLPYGIAALFYGPLVRFFDARKVELVCFFLFAFANLIAAISRSITALFIARFMMGLFGASVVPLVLILIADWAKDKFRGRLVGIFFGSTFVASLAGLFLSGLISWRLIFLIPAIMGLVLWGLMYLYLPSFKQAGPAIKVNYLAAFKDKRIISLFTYIFFISLLYHGLQQWLGVYFSSSFGFSQFLISMLITLTSLSGIFGEVLGGWLSDTLGRLKTINIGIGLMILSAFLLIFRMPWFILALIMVIWGLGWTFNHAGLSTRLTDLPKEFVNEAASLNSSVRFISGGLGVLVGAALMKRSFSLGFAAFGVCLLILLLSTKIRHPIMRGKNDV
jgi:predicted MFS family arabinose efflux permease